MTTEPAVKWTGLSDDQARSLVDAGITPQNIGHAERVDILRLDSCGPGTIRALVRAGFTLADIPTSDPNEAVEALDLPMELYLDLVNRGFEIFGDFAGNDSETSPPTDGCYLITWGWTIENVALLRQALQDAGTRFANLSYMRHLSDIPFDDQLRELLREQGIDTTIPLHNAGPAYLMELLKDRLGDRASDYLERVSHAYWVAGYESL